MKLILTLALFFTSSFASAQQMSCGAFVSGDNTPQSPLILTAEAEVAPSLDTAVTKDDPAAIVKDDRNAEEILAELDAESESLAPTSALVEKHLKALRTNEKLRAAKGGYARVLTAERTAKITRLKSALRDGNKDRVWAAVDQVMLETEMDAVWLNHYQKQFKALPLEKAAAGDAHKLFLDSQEAELKKKIEGLMEKLHGNYTLYRAFRATFENQITNGRSDKDKAFAKDIFSRTGIDNPSLQIDLPDSVGIEPGQRPSIDFIRDEYHAHDFADGTPRHLSGLGLFYKITLENKALKSVRFWSFIKYSAAHKFIDFISQKYRAFSEKYYESRILKALDWITKDLQNQEALEKHLAEIDSIDSVHASRQYKTFQIAIANAKNQSSLRSEDFGFLTSFARAHEYKKTWKRLHLTTALRNVGGLSLVDKILSLDRQLALQDVALDLILKEIKESGELLAVDQTLPENVQKIITAKEKIEAEILKVETEIRVKIEAFLASENDTTAAVIRPDLKDDILLYKEMQRANDRATNMGPLSYEFSPGSGAKFTAYTTATVLITIKLFNEFGGPELTNQLLTSITGKSFADWQATIYQAPETVNHWMQVIQGSGAL